MTRRFSKAIRDTGGSARIPGGDGKAFAVSIQPLRGSGGTPAETGAGCLHRYKLYAAFDEITASLREGSVLEYNGEKYLAEDIETICFGGKPVFRQGILAALREGEA